MLQNTNHKTYYRDGKEDLILNLLKAEEKPGNAVQLWFEMIYYTFCPEKMHQPTNIFSCIVGNNIHKRGKWLWQCHQSKQFSIKK